MGERNVQGAYLSYTQICLAAEEEVAARDLEEVRPIDRAVASVGSEGYQILAGQRGVPRHPVDRRQLFYPQKASQFGPFGLHLKAFYDQVAAFPSHQIKAITVFVDFLANGAVKCWVFSSRALVDDQMVLKIEAMAKAHFKDMPFSAGAWPYHFSLRFDLN